ncbi:MAG: aminopeptidase P family protein [Acidobacteriota bacterium]|nr:aminopeptidase P family protein [Acidobacteriota bacterium]
MAYASADFLHARHGRLRQALRDAGLDGLVVTCLPNIFYLTNFGGSAAILVITADRLRFITDFRYVTAVESARAAGTGPPDLELVRVESGYDETLVALLKEMPGSRVGFEAAHLPVSRHGWLLGALGTGACTLVPTEELVETQRVCKDAHERETLRIAAAMLSGATPDILGEVRAGRTERDVAAAVDWRIRQAGFARPAFETIVASGPNGALPHARPGDRTLTAGDLVVLDFGGVYDGYCVDLTRMASLGSPGPEGRRVYDAVAEANAAGVAAVAPGVSRFAIDAAARETLGRHGLAEYFGHGTGHGLGIDVHERPRISKRPAAAAPPGADAEAVDEHMVFTIEPGAYLPGRLGVRIEDDVLVTASGVEVLTTVSRDLALR